MTEVSHVERGEMLLFTRKQNVYIILCRKCVKRHLGNETGLNIFFFCKC